MFADPAVCRYIGDGSPRPRDRVELSLRNGLRCWQEHHFGPFIIETRATENHAPTFVGDCVLFPIARSGTDGADFNARGPEIEIGYRLAQHAWGHGYATEAAQAVLHWARHDPTGPRLPQLLAVTFPANTASRRVLEKLGMHYLGETNAYYDTTTSLYESAD